MKFASGFEIMEYCQKVAEKFGFYDHCLFHTTVEKTDWDETWIARQLGHSTTEMLFRVYSRYVPNLTRQDGSAFEAILTRTLSE